MRNAKFATRCSKLDNFLKNQSVFSSISRELVFPFLTSSKRRIFKTFKNTFSLNLVNPLDNFKRIRDKIFLPLSLYNEIFFSHLVLHFYRSLFSVIAFKIGPAF